MRTDFNSLTGNWPFRKLRYNTIDDLKRKYDKYEIDTAYVASMDAIFYNDPFEGDAQLADELKNTKYKQALSINPSLPLPKRDIDKAYNSFDFGAIRVYPSIHGYDIVSTMFDEFLNIVKEYNKPLFLSSRMGDARVDYLLKQKSIDIESIRKIINNNYGLPIVLMNLKYDEILSLKSDIIKSDNIRIDISDVKHALFAIDKLSDAGLADKMVFGSFYPLYAFECSYLNMESTQEDIRERIFNKGI